MITIILGGNDMATVKKELNIQMGNRLRNIRENNGYSQEKFAETLGVVSEHYRKMENGTYGIIPEKMILLHQEYKVDLNYLVAGDTMPDFDFEKLEIQLTNCNRQQRIEAIRRMFAYLEELAIRFN